jgi:SAM-dependent methyltransferase
MGLPQGVSEMNEIERVGEVCHPSGTESRIDQAEAGLEGRFRVGRRPRTANRGDSMPVRSLYRVAKSKRKRLSAWLVGEGIEVGALNNPLGVHRKALVRFVDRLPVDEQRRRYPELAEGFLAPVDEIATAEDLAPFKDASLDFVIANHLLEHLEDPIAGLLEFERVLKPGGVLYLGLPDQRQTFDRDRELTSVEHLFRDHEQGPAVSRRDHYVDWARNVAHALPDDVTATADACMADEYNIHFHCWQADTFVDFFVATREKTGLDFELVALAPPENEEDIEFIVILVKGRFSGVRFPPPYPRSRVRDLVARTPLGPPLMDLNRSLRRLRRRLTTRRT